MKNTALTQLLQAYAPQHIIDTLSPFILDPRKNRIETVIAHRLENITVAIESPSDMHNALAIVRSAEAFGLSSVHIIAPEHEATSIRSVTQGSCYWIQMQFYQTLDEFLVQIKSENKMLLGATVDANDNLNDIVLDNPICLLFGNEDRGLSTAAKAACDGFFTIAMHGMVESLNLSVAAAVSIFQLTQQKRHLKNTGDLTPKTATQLRAQYYLNSVNSRLILQLLPLPSQ